MARRPFDPASLGLRNTEYRQGDVLDRDAVDALAAEADVLVHLAFIILGGRDETRAINLTGSRNVFTRPRATCERLVYTSSVAAYGFHADNPQPLTEDVRPRGSERFYYSAQKAELEASARRGATTATEAYVLRPCIVAGPDAQMLLRELPQRRLPLTDRRCMPDPGTPFQLVHHDDVAQALVAATLGDAPPGAYNLAGDGTITLGDLARALGWLVRARARAAGRRGGARRRRCRWSRLVQWVNATPRAGGDGHDARPSATSAGRRATARARRWTRSSRRRSGREVGYSPLRKDYESQSRGRAVAHRRRAAAGRGRRRARRGHDARRVARWPADRDPHRHLAPMSPLALRRLPRAAAGGVWLLPRRGAARGAVRRAGGDCGVAGLRRRRCSTTATRSTTRCSARTSGSRPSPRRALVLLGAAIALDGRELADHAAAGDRRGRCSAARRRSASCSACRSSSAPSRADPDVLAGRAVHPAALVRDRRRRTARRSSPTRSAGASRGARCRR